MNPENKNKGLLYIVATPIGNLDDITARALQVLRQVDIIACEDTRHSGRLLANYGIKNRLMSFHQHNENESAAKFIELIRQGHNIALISDAGTPLISDPGYPLVKLAHEYDIKVIPIVGASAIIALLSCSGLATNEFHFYGFLAAKQKQRQGQLAMISENTGTSIIYESTHRIIKCLKDIEIIFGGEHIIVMGRELTKTFETIKQAPVAEMIAFIEADANQQKGEFVLAIQAKEVVVSTQLTTQQKQLALLLAKEMAPKKAAKITAEFLNTKSKEVYNYIISQ
jgi:16S rRNA (cytidine1402-2'-O)-methyltransferase